MVNIKTIKEEVKTEQSYKMISKIERWCYYKLYGDLIMYVPHYAKGLNVPSLKECEEMFAEVERMKINDSALFKKIKAL